MFLNGNCGIVSACQFQLSHVNYCMRSFMVHDSWFMIGCMTYRNFRTVLSRSAFVESIRHCSAKSDLWSVFCFVGLLCLCSLPVEGGRWAWLTSLFARSRSCSGLGVSSFISTSVSVPVSMSMSMLVSSFVCMVELSGSVYCVEWWLYGWPIRRVTK